MLSTLGCLQPSTPRQAVHAIPPALLPALPQHPKLPPHTSPLQLLTPWPKSSRWKNMSSQGSQGASRAEPFSRGWYGNGWLAPCKSLSRVHGGAMLLGRGLNTAQVWERTKWTSSWCFYSVLKRNHKPTKSHGQCPTASVLCSLGWGLQARQLRVCSRHLLCLGQALGMENAAWLRSGKYFPFLE